MSEPFNFVIDPVPEPPPVDRRRGRKTNAWPFALMDVGDSCRINRATSTCRRAVYEFLRGPAGTAPSGRPKRFLVRKHADETKVWRLE
jgi:hypothetical protein